MESAFAWLSQLVETIYRFVPHILIVRATHGGVKWVRGRKIKPLNPGLHLYWPLTTEVEVIVTARQTIAIPDQVLATKDGRKVVVKTLVVYKIRDVVHAIGRVNWDVDVTINDLTQSAVVRVVATHTYDEIMNGIADDSLTTTLTREVRKELRQFGVHVVRSKLVDFAECKVFKLLTSQADKAGMSSHQFYQ
jgi:regulator of protease activity HflC (stomatin/prohibitin superfamily)